MHAQEPASLTDHWDRVYRTKDVTRVSWYQPRPALSLELLGRVARPGDRLVDVGSGASLLVDHLLDQRPLDITLLDISSEALSLVRRRLGERAHRVRFVASDLLAWAPEGRFDLWHDRAVFHFLTAPQDRRRYVRLLRDHLVPGGHALLSTFHLQGPERCSDLPTARYDARALHQELGADHFELLEERVELHPHPRGGTQAFQVALFRRI